MSKVKSATLKAVQQAFFDEVGIAPIKVSSKKNAADCEWPTDIEFTSDGNKATHVANGLYRYTESITKKDKMVQFYFEDLLNLIKVNLIK